MNAFVGVACVGVIVSMAVLAVTWLELLAPRLAIGGVVFGVTTPEGFVTSDPGRRIIRRYRVGVGAVGLGALVMVALLSARGVVSLLGGVLFPVIALDAALWLRARAATLPHAAPPSSVLRAEVGVSGSAVPPVLEAVSIAILVSCALWVAARWSDIPIRFAVHFDVSGTPDRFADRGPALVFAPFVTGGGICLALVALRWVLANLARKRTSDPRGRASWRLASISLGGAALLNAMVCSSVGLLPILPTTVPTLIVGAGGVAVLLVMLAVGAWRIAEQPSAGGDGSDDSRWRLGMFYVNPADPALFVTKRGGGVGYTINLGLAAGRGVMIAMLGVAVLIVLALGLL